MHDSVQIASSLERPSSSEFSLSGLFLPDRFPAVDHKIDVVVTQHRQSHDQQPKLFTGAVECRGPGQEEFHRVRRLSREVPPGTVVTLTTEISDPPVGEVAYRVQPFGIERSVKYHEMDGGDR